MGARCAPFFCLQLGCDDAVRNTGYKIYKKAIALQCVKCLVTYFLELVGHFGIRTNFGLRFRLLLQIFHKAQSADVGQIGGGDCLHRATDRVGECIDFKERGDSA